MIANERYVKILELLKSREFATIGEIVKLLNISESTVRRDLNELDKQRKLIKVHGGAMLNNNSYVTEELSIGHKKLINIDKKRMIARKASTLINPQDFVYIDSGTTTFEMTKFIFEKSVTYVTNSISIAQNLIDRNFRTIILGGKIKYKTQAIIGSFAREYIQNLNFTIGFFGTNGVCLNKGYTTPDLEEAIIKQVAINNSEKVFVLCDNSKFNLVFPVTFSNLVNTSIITNKTKDSDFIDSLKQKVEVLEV